MSKYILKRIAMGILSVFIVATLTFFLMNLVPGGPFVAEKSISKAAQEALAAKFGLDKPLHQRYLTYMTDFLHGDMGFSLRQRGRTLPLSEWEEIGQEDPPPEDEALLRQIDELPTAVATVIRLRFFEELSLKEIAAATGTNVNTVKSRLYAGLKKLRIAMEGENIL